MKNHSEMAGNAQRAAPCDGQPKPSHHVSQEDVALRWNISPRTLERWRRESRGPAYLKMGGRVVYRMADIEAFEAERRRNPAAAPSNSDGGAR